MNLHFLSKSLHYILDFLWSVGQWQTKTFEQDREVFVGAADGAQADILARTGRQNHIEASHFGHFFEQFTRRRAQAGSLHPLLECPPHDESEEANKDVGLGAFLCLVENGPEPQVVFCDAKTVLDLRQADVGSPEFFGASALEVRAQQIAAVGFFNPFAQVVARPDLYSKSFPAFVMTIGNLGDLNSVQVRGARVLLEESADAAVGCVAISQGARRRLGARLEARQAFFDPFDLALAHGAFFLAALGRELLRGRDPRQARARPPAP